MTNRGASRAASSRHHPRWTVQVSHAFDKAHARAKQLTCQWRVAKRRPDPVSEGYRKVSPKLSDAQEHLTGGGKEYQKPVLVQAAAVKDMTFEIESVAQRTAAFYLQESHTQQQLVEAQKLALKKERRKTTIPPHSFKERTSSADVPPSSNLTIPTRTLSLSFKPVAFELEEMIDLELEMEKEWDAKVETRQQLSPTRTIRLATGKSCLKQPSSSSNHASSNILKKSVRFDIENEIGRARQSVLMDQQGLERSGSYQKYMKLKQNMVKLDMSLDEFRRMRVFESGEDGGLLEEMQSVMTSFAAAAAE
ncbi:hypothetical protein HDU77_003929 [Chytriomyces hyalinus]|nr:hypothetical protein HDU77_003929 [Chytriomyces hyalinus]